MKDIKSYILESSRETDPNYVVSSFPVGKMKIEIDKAYGCDIQINVEEDIVIFENEDPPIFFTIERVPKKIVCPEGMEEFLKEKFGFTDDDFIK